MTQRERTLAILVLGLLLVVGLYWGFSRYQKALQFRDNRIAALTEEQLKLQEQLLQGAYADRQLGEYVSRSLPSSPERAQSDYMNWLLGWVNEYDLADPDVDAQGIQMVQDSERQPLYQQLSFRVTGKADLPELIELLHGFYAKDYLHRIRELSVSQSRSDHLALTMIIDAVSLNAADADAPPPVDDSWRVGSNVAVYRDAILNRNFFAPPNQVPQFDGRPEIEAIVGETTEATLSFKDPEGHDLSYELAEDSPDFARLDPASGSLQLAPAETGEYELLVRATDNGYPGRTAEQTLSVRVSEPTPEEAPEPDFDDARLTFLTGLTEGRDGWMAWLKVRTRDETEHLRIGDGFQIGSVQGTVVAASSRYATIEAGGRRFDLKPGQSLAEAARDANSEPVE